MLARRFIGEFRHSAEAAEILRTTERNGNLQISKVAGEKWRAMDADAKAVSNLVSYCGALAG